MEPENVADFICAKYFIHSAYCIMTRNKSLKEREETEAKKERKEPRNIKESQEEHLKKLPLAVVQEEEEKKIGE